MRVAAIRYLNTLPLIYGLQRNPDHELILESPSSCFNLLITKEVDVALIPVFGTQINSSVQAVRGIGIAAEKKTESVLLYSFKQINEIKKIAIDPASLTSVNLLKIILRKKYRTNPEFVTLEEKDLAEALHKFDAVLIIGDAAILGNVEDVKKWDLATEWNDFTGLGFIFAVWGALRPLISAEQEVFRQSLVDGLNSMDQIVQEGQKKISVDIDFLKRYYNHDLHYQLTPNDYQGFSKYLALAADLKLMKNIRTDIWM
jgi:predicted solute-binding protein